MTDRAASSGPSDPLGGWFKEVVQRIHDPFLLTILGVLLIEGGVIIGLASRNPTAGVIGVVGLLLVGAGAIYVLMRAEQGQYAKIPDTYDAYDRLPEDRRKAVRALVADAVATARQIVEGDEGDVRATVFAMRGGRLQMIQDFCSPAETFSEQERAIRLRPVEGVAGRCYDWKQSIVADERMVRDISPVWRELLAKGLRAIVSMPIMDESYESVLWVMNVDILRRRPTLAQLTEIESRLRGVVQQIHEALSST